jgi:CRISPR-associated protein Csb3
MNDPTPAIRIDVDVTNPGQFFACCGLLELADRLWPGAEGWFEPGARTFNINCVGTLQTLVTSLHEAKLVSTMTAQQRRRLEELSTLKAKELKEQPSLEDEKKHLEKLRRESPLVLLTPFSIRLDWFEDDFSGGGRFNTWAGQQSVESISTSMKHALSTFAWWSHPPKALLDEISHENGLGFNFDSHASSQGSALDVGFSLDSLSTNSATRITVGARPYLEFLAFVGLQRFRPLEVSNENRFKYQVWTTLLNPMLAAGVSSCAIDAIAHLSFEFRLLYRTKYLKSFLNATPCPGESNVHV